MAYTDILKVIPTVQSAALVEHNLKFLKKKKKKSSDFVGSGVTNIVGSSMIAENAKFLYG